MKRYIEQKPNARLDELVQFIQDNYQVKVDESTVSRAIRSNKWRAVSIFLALSILNNAGLVLIFFTIQSSADSPLPATQDHSSPQQQIHPPTQPHQQQQQQQQHQQQSAVKTPIRRRALTPRSSIANAPQPPTTMSQHIPGLTQTPHMQSHQMHAPNMTLNPTNGMVSANMAHAQHTPMQHQAHPHQFQQNGLQQNGLQQNGIPQNSLPQQHLQNGQQGLPNNMTNNLNQQNVLNPALQNTLQPVQSLSMQPGVLSPHTHHTHPHARSAGPQQPQQQVPRQQLAPQTQLQPPMQSQQQMPAPQPTDPALQASHPHAEIIEQLRRQNEILMESQKQQQLELQELRREMARLTGIFTRPPTDGEGFQFGGLGVQGGG